jgi:hypothetical protein
MAATRTERALQTLLINASFECATVAEEVARAAANTAQAEREVATLRVRCDCAATELREAAQKAPINPPLLKLMHRLYQQEHDALELSQGRLGAAEQEEERARTRFAEARNRERGLERALLNNRRMQSRERQTREWAWIDDMWLISARNGDA